MSGLEARIVEGAGWSDGPHTEGSLRVHVAVDSAGPWVGVDPDYLLAWAQRVREEAEIRSGNGIERTTFLRIPDEDEP